MNARRTIAVFGATSAIAEAAIRVWAARGDHLTLVGHDLEKLKVIQADLKTRYSADAKIFAADLADTSLHADLVGRIYRQMGKLDQALVAYGVLGAQSAFEQLSEAIDHLMQVNLTSQASLLLHLSARFEKQRSGTLAAISSVAGDRGRPSNYVYAASKSGLSTFLSGLRARLSPMNVAVVNIKPGFVDTPMTAHFKKGLLWAKPEGIAKKIVKSMDCGCNVVYVPWFWRWIMLIIKLIPEPIFKKMQW